MNQGYPSNCGCFYPFPEAGCYNSQYQTPSGPFPCHPHYPSLRANFTVPAVRSSVIIEVTDTEMLHQYQGIQIGGGFYMIMDILDSLKLDIQHNGVPGDTVGNIVVAVHPQYGCYQYPVVPGGKVTLDVVPSTVGLEADLETAVASGIHSTSARQLAFGSLGPTTIEFNAEVTVNVNASVNAVGISLPVPARTGIPQPAFTALIDSGLGLTPVASVLGAGGYSNYAVVWFGDEVTYPDATDIRVLISGQYEMLV